ncbi:acyltransferase domain-containing protein [Streptomyces sioyaensis]|uniref:acyltransferase domain-containing protein n=1 Tax=Streptomyces sioyaensis TaxID=67364 RepID=UPI0037B70720
MLMSVQSEKPRVALLFPGQGAQQVRMGMGLYGAEPVFTQVMDEFFVALGEDGPVVRSDWLSAHPGPMFDDCSRAQPLLFAVGSALAAAVVGRDIRPEVLVGHSVGELAAAATAGVFDIQDAGRVMAARTKAMAATVPGGMLAVATGVDRVREVLGNDLGNASGDGVAIAAINTPRQTVLAGSRVALAAAQSELSAQLIACHPARARQAFHSPLCEEAAAEFSGVFASIALRPPAIAIRSTYTGRDVTDQQAVTPDFWAVQLARPVQYWPAVDSLLQSGRYLLLEAGPGGSSSALLRRHPAIRSGASRVLPLLSTIADNNAYRVFEGAISEAASLNGASAGLP